MRIIRTIHPVGQGAFYSERFIDEDDNTIALIVYDCGSKNIIKLNNEISSLIREGEGIDILFISHFDDDHINGVKKLKELNVKIKTVVIPLLDRNDEWFYICSGGSLVKQAVRNPKLFFDAENMIRVKSIPENNEEWVNEVYTISDDASQLDNCLPSGATITLQSISAYWLYIPFNFQEKTRREKLVDNLKRNQLFLNLINQRKCSIGDLLHDENIIEKYHVEINKAYKKVCSDGSNRCSLIVYSGTGVRVNQSHVRVWSYNGFCSCLWDKAGCLYLGDTDLKQGRGCNNILGLLKKALSQYLDLIGTIQLPHHGADRNYNKSLPNINCKMKVFFASFGKRNKYKHPSSNVLLHIMQKSCCFYGVHEQKESKLVEYISCDSSAIKTIQ